MSRSRAGTLRMEKGVELPVLFLRDFFSALTRPLGVFLNFKCGKFIVAKRPKRGFKYLFVESGSTKWWSVK